MSSCAMSIDLSLRIFLLLCFFSFFKSGIGFLDKMKSVLRKIKWLRMLYLTRKVYAVSPSFLNIFILCPASSHQPAVCYSCVSGHLGDFSTSQWVTDCNPHFLPWEMQKPVLVSQDDHNKTLGWFQKIEIYFLSSGG